MPTSSRCIVVNGLEKLPALLPLPPVSDYIIHSKQITLLANLDAAKRKLLNDRWQLIHPTEEQLLSYLNSKELLYASKTISNTDS